MKEFFNAPEEILSFKAALEETLQFKYTGLHHFPDTIVPIIRTKLAEFIPKLMNDIVDELDLALKDAIVSLEGILTATALSYIRLDTCYLV